MAGNGLQRTDEWRQARCGKLTASRFHEAVARIKSGWGTQREKYLWELVTERLTGVPKMDGFKSPSMRFGTDNEHLARASYEFYCEPVELISFVDHPYISNAGASPDGYVGQDGMVEFKVPDSYTHLRMFFEEEPIPDRYMKQMYWQLACCPERKWVDFVSFDPRVDEDLCFKRIRIARDPHIIRAMEDEAKQFLSEVDAKLMRIHARRQAAGLAVR